MEVLSHLLAIEGSLLYVAISVALLGGAIGLPIPEDLPLIVAGKLLAEQRVNLLLTFCICYCSILAGDLLIFSIGYWGGKRLLSTQYCMKRFKQQHVLAIKHKLERHSLSMIFVARHLFYLRTLTFLTCGAFRMRTSRFLAADALAAMISTPLLLALGYYTSDYINTLLTTLAKFKSASLMLSLVLLIAIAWLWTTRHRGNSKHC